MENRVILNIETSNGVYVIPFIDLYKLDRWTVVFSNEEEMINSINRILGLSIDLSDVVSIYISSDRYMDRDNNSLSNIKYSGDNWNFDSLKDMLSLYLKQDHRRIRKCDVRFVNTHEMTMFQAGYDISDRDIDLAVKIYLKDNYKKQRDMYFMIKNFGSIRTDKVGSYMEEVRRNELSKGESINDDFIQYLIELSGRGVDYLDKAMDELSKSDLEEIERVLTKPERGIFDGFRTVDEEKSLEEDMICLVEFTGMSIEELKEIQPNNGLNLGRRR